MEERLENILHPKQKERRKRIQFMLKEIRDSAISIKDLYEIMKEKFGISYSTFREYLRDMVMAKEVEIVKMLWATKSNY